MSNIKLLTGTSNKPLAYNVANILNQPLERMDVGRFSDGEIHVEIKDNVRGSKAIIIQSTCAPSNDNLMELFLIADALKRSSVSKIVAVIPYLGYSRQDRRPGYSRVPISARVVADFIETVKIDHIVTIDLHVTQIQGFFRTPVDNLSPTRIFVNDITTNYGLDNIIVVSPDIGGVARARSIAKHLGNADLAIIDKRRPKPNVSEVMNIIGDVKDKICIITDDIVDSGGTLCNAVNALIEKGGASKVVAYCTHGVLSGAAADNLQNSRLTELVITDTIPLRPDFICDKVRVLSVADMLAETITRINTSLSVSAMLD
jgi:ribose-phosphate pyrophosphokinase